jgi:hypothetical protein
VLPRADSCAGEILAAGLVVDASGCGGRTPAWLTEIGYDPPRSRSGSTSCAPAGTCGCAPGALGEVKLVLIGGWPARILLAATRPGYARLERRAFGAGQARP